MKPRQLVEIISCAKESKMIPWRDRVVVMAHIDRLTKAHNDLYTIVGPLIGAVECSEDRQRIAKTMDPQWDSNMNGVVECRGIRYQPSTGDWEMVNKAMVDEDGKQCYVSRADLCQMLGVKTSDKQAELSEG